MKKDIYLQNIPNELTGVGIQKVLLVRREMIHLKHIRKEIFINRTVDINNILEELGLSLFEYIQFMSNRERQIFKINRNYQLDNINEVVKSSETFGSISKLYKSVENVEYICTENIDILNHQWFTQLVSGFTISSSISYILSSLQKNKIVIVVSNDKKLLTTCWCFGAKTFYNANNKVQHFSLKTE